jgi:pimeloyl-ACP methyl ester carboxylesterase
VPAEGAAFNTQSREEFVANWDRQVGCPGQYETSVRDAVWGAMVESDPVGATWGGGVRRAPQTTTWGWTKDVVAKTKTPMLLVAGEHDKQVPPSRVHEMYEDLGSPKKVVVDLACASHNAMWEKVRLTLYEASVEWLTKGTVQGKEAGELKLQ